MDGFVWQARQAEGESSASADTSYIITILDMISGLFRWGFFLIVFLTD
jgi:hypothetical protein